MTSMPAEHFGLHDRGALRARARGGRGRARPRPARGRLDARATRSTTSKGVDEVLVNGTAVVSAGEHTGARARQAPAADVIESTSARTSARRPTEEMWEAMRSARSAWRSSATTRASTSSSGAAPSCSARRRRCSCRPARSRTSPPCSRSPDPGGRRRPARPRAHPRERGRLAHGDRAASTPVGLRRGRDGRRDLPREHAYAERRHRDGRRERPPRSPRAAPRAHLDGARLANAAVALGVPLAELAAPVDTVALSLNKGLSAPFGAILAGDAETIAAARVHLKRLGGGTVHKAGILAAAGLVALDRMLDRLADDHRPRARAGRADRRRPSPRRTSSTPTSARAPSRRSGHAACWRWSSRAASGSSLTG